MRFDEAQFSVQREVDSRGGVPRVGPVRPTPRAPATVFALLRVIPDDPDYRKHIPLKYRLNAKSIVGETAQDISLRGPKAHLWIELSHIGLAAAEIALEASVLVAGLAIAGPLLALVGGFLALGAPLAEAAEKIAANWSATGFSRGVVMGANRRKASLLRDYFGNLYFPPNYTFPHGRNIAIANYKVGLLVGYVQGRLLTKNRHAIFWRDLGHHMGDQSFRGPQNQWRRREWVDWYTDAAAVFRREHLV